MKFYTLDTEFTFGKYEGKTVKEILEIQPTYLDWCAINLDHFYISDEIIAEIKVIKPDFTITEEGKQKLADKYSTWENEQQQDDNDDYDDYDRRESYGQYAGSYAQDVEGLSDDFINDVLDGDPDAYWNID
jgi:broad specificity phosphatase PhoE